MDPNKIELESITKLFEYERISRELDECNDVNKMRDLCKSYVKLYMKQEEVVANLCKNF